MLAISTSKLVGGLNSTIMRFGTRCSSFVWIASGTSGRRKGNELRVEDFGKIRESANVYHCFDDGGGILVSHCSNSRTAHKLRHAEVQSIAEHFVIHESDEGGDLARQLWGTIAQASAIVVKQRHDQVHAPGSASQCQPSSKPEKFKVPRT